MADKDDEKTDAEEMLEAHHKLEEKILEDKGRVFKVIAAVSLFFLALLVVLFMWGIFFPIPTMHEKMEF